MSPGYRRYALGVITAVYALNFVDRGLMVLLLQPIKQDLQLSDTQLGFVTGIAFGLFYAIWACRSPAWADRGKPRNDHQHRDRPLGLTVMSSLFIGSYAQLVAARVAAAVGKPDASLQRTRWSATTFRNPQLEPAPCRSTGWRARSPGW
jgi:hypothetical protein